MRCKPMFWIVLLLLNSPVSFGQTASDIETRYGKPTYAYSVSGNVWMTPEYSADGQVCRMRLYPKRFAGDVNYVSASGGLPFDDFRKVVDRLVPLDTRGAKGDPFYSGWATGGGARWAIFTYMRVSITYAASFRIDPKALIDREDFVFSEEALALAKEKPKARVQPEDDFLNYRESKAEIVTITWHGKKCAVN